MTTIVVMNDDSPSVVLFDGDITTVLMPSQTSQSVVIGGSLQTVIFNTEGPVGPSGNAADPGDLLDIYEDAKD